MTFIDFPPVNITVQGMEKVRIPKMCRVEQIYDNSYIADIAVHVRQQMYGSLTNHARFSGKRICITAGSRGIPDLDVIIRTIVDVLLEWGAEPFIIPAMGSHGGATAEGQREILATYNITEESMGVPVLSSMEVVKIGVLSDGTDIYCDKYAAESDGIVVLNKVKPHTDFRGKHESGLAKMMAIGLAKHVGASQFHMRGFETFAERIPQVCEVFLKNAPIAFGVGIVQNAYDRISHIEVMERELILEKDAELLEIARKSTPTFKFDDIDLLIIDEIGKNISGNGFDPNIVGRSNSPGFENVLRLKKLFIRGLNEETHHNGCGINQADITTRRCMKSLDVESMWINLATNTILAGGKLPMYVESDRDAIRLAIRSCTNTDQSNPRVVRIRDTLHMGLIEVSEALVETCRQHPEMRVVTAPKEMVFDDEGFLTEAL